MLFEISYLNGTIFNCVQPRLEDFLKNDDIKQKQKTQQMFYKFDNFCIYIKKIGNKNENKAIEKQFLILKQTQWVIIYGSRFETLAYIIKWDDAALASKFYENFLLFKILIKKMFFLTNAFKRAAIFEKSRMKRL